MPRTQGVAYETQPAFAGLMQQTISASLSLKGQVAVLRCEVGSSSLPHPLLTSNGLQWKF